MQLLLEEDDQRAENTGKCICCVAASSITAGTLALCQCFTWLVAPERFGLISHLIGIYLLSCPALFSQLYTNKTTFSSPLNCPPNL